MKFRKTFWINIILLLILSSSFSTQIIAQNPQFVTFPVNILMILLLLTPILTNISLSTANTNKLNLLSIILCMVSLIAAFYFLASGDKFEGQFKDGKKHGQGTYTFANGDVYKGQFKDDKKHGQGTEFYESGNKYEGQFKDGLKNGLGTYFYENGDKYEGQFKDDLKNGQGSFKYVKRVELASHINS